MGVTRALVAAVLSIVCAGCGYGFSNSGSTLPIDIKRIYVPMVENDTPESGVSTLVTEALRDQFERYGVVSVVDTIQDADAVLRVRVRSIKRETRSVTSATDTVLQLTTNMTLTGELQRVTGPMLWRNNNINVSKTFGTTSDVVVTSSADFASGNLNPSDLAALDSREVSRGQEQAAFDAIAEEAARIMYEDAVAPDF